MLFTCPPDAVEPSVYGDAVSGGEQFSVMLGTTGINQDLLELRRVR